MKNRGRPRGFDREAALRTAMLTFWNQGFEATSMSDLTEAMGIRSASLYAAFGSKEALFREAVDYYQTRLGPMIWAPLEDPDASVAEAIERVLVATAEAFSNPEFPAGCLIMLGAHHAHAGSSAVGDELRERRGRDIARLRERFDRAVVEGELTERFDSIGAAAFYAALQAGMSIMARDGADRGTLSGIAGQGAAALAGMSREALSSKDQTGSDTPLDIA